MGEAQKPVLIIAGPTASGKSGLALAVAVKKNGVIINADSMQIYAGLPLLAAQPPREDMTQAPHRLYAVLHPNDSCSAARWRGMALEEIEKAHGDNRLPILTGGTGFYLKALTEGLSPMPEVPQKIREKYSARQQEIGTAAFFEELQQADPEIAAKLDPSNPQRLIRAFEVLAHTGKSLAEWQKAPLEKPPAHLRFITVTLLPPREDLYRNCDARFDIMMQTGALEEAADFLKKIEAHEISATAPLAKALGFPELADFLRGKKTKEEATEAAKISTRHYAKRQTTWFRNQVTADLVLENPDPERVADLAGL